MAGRRRLCQVLDDASHATQLVSAAGQLSTGGLAGVGAGVDFGALTKDTRAFIAGTASASGDIIIEALSFEDVASRSGTSGVADLASIAAAGSVYLIAPTTQAFADSGAVLTADGTILIDADDRTEVDQIAGSLDAATGVAAGA